MGRMLSTFMIQSCAKSVLPHCLSLRGFQRGKQHMLSFMSCRSDGPLRSYQIGVFDVLSNRKKINSEHKAVKDLQCSALINEGLYQLSAHDWCVNISAVTQFGTRRRVTPLFTEHKDHKQAHCQVWMVGHFKELMAYPKISTLSQQGAVQSNSFYFVGFLRNLVFR